MSEYDGTSSDSSDDSSDSSGYSSDSSGDNSAADTANAIKAAAQLAQIIASAAQAVKAQDQENAYLAALKNATIKDRNVAISNYQSQDSFDKAGTIARALKNSKFNPAPQTKQFDPMKPIPPSTDYTGNILPGLLDSASRSGLPNAIGSAVVSGENDWRKWAKPAWSQPNIDANTNDPSYSGDIQPS